MILEIEITLTKKQEKLLGMIHQYEIEDTEEFYPTEKMEDDVEKLIELGLVDSVMGEQFYVSTLGKLYIKKLADNEKSK